jgi:hypothetical protein
MVDPYEQTRVNHVPERLSPRNRTRVHNLSATYRNRPVQHEPDSHSDCRDHSVTKRPR